MEIEFIKNHEKVKITIEGPEKYCPKTELILQTHQTRLSEHQHFIEIEESSTGSNPLVVDTNCKENSGELCSNGHSAPCAAITNVHVYNQKTKKSKRKTSQKSVKYSGGGILSESSRQEVQKTKK